MNSLALLPLVLALASPVLLGQEPAQEWLTKNVVLQVEQEPDYEATDIVRMLSMNSYLGAIDPDLAISWGSYADGRVAVKAELASQEIVALTFTGANAAALDDARAKLLAHLSSLVPTRRRTMQQSLARAEHDVAEAEKAVAAMDAEVGSFRDRNGGDVVDVLNEVQMLLRQHRNERITVDDRLAVAAATRDYLREAIRSRYNGTTLEDLESELADLRFELDEAKKSKAPTHPDAVKLEKRIGQLEAQLESARPKPRDPGLEARLFAVEEEVFGYERRREWLIAQIAEKTEMERALARTRDAWRSLEAKSHQAQMRLTEARGALFQLERDYARMPQNEWIRVVAG